MLLSTHLYLAASTTAFLIALLIMSYRPDLKKRMLFSGIVFGLFGFFLEYYFFNDYWTPPLILGIPPFGGVEDFLFGFAVGSVGSVLYDLFYKDSYEDPVKTHYWVFPFMIMLQILAIQLFSLNSIYASAIGFTMTGVLVVALKPDLFVRGMFTAVASAIILVIGEFIFIKLNPKYLNDYFLLYKDTSYILGTVPVTEFIWSLAFGFMIGTIFFYYKHS